jgi:hypothetical protein
VSKGAVLAAIKRAIEGANVASTPAQKLQEFKW